MIGLSLKESARTAALDGALSFSILLQNQRELTLNSAQSSVSGLLAAIQSAPTGYAQLLDAVNGAVTAQNAAATKLSQPPWAETSNATRAAIQHAVDQALAALAAPLETSATNAKTQAATAKASATNPSTEYTLASQLETTAALLLTGIDQLADGDAATAAQTIASARDQATATLGSAQTLLGTLQGQNPVPTQRIAVVQAVIAAAQAVIAAADQATQSTATPLALAGGETPSSHTLTTDTPPATTLTTWGDSGVISITDATGKGIMIGHDGRVDTVPPSGQGWQFVTAGTFLLPDGTKISITPGNPASVLATRGEQQIAITNLRPGQPPTTTLSSAGGLEADAARNDGHVFEMGADQRSWTLSGSTLGDVGGSREIVATTPLVNEHAVDVTNVTLDPALVSQLEALGLDPAEFDANEDGLYSNEELQALVSALESAVSGAQGRFDTAIESATAAAASLMRLNQFLERLLSETDRRQDNREQAIAAERDQLLQIQRELDSARATLKITTPTPPPPQNVLAAARVVLNEVQTFGSEAPASLTPSFETPPAPLSPAPTNDTTPPPSSSGPITDPLAVALRRAGRLLSGLGHSGPRFVDTPPAPNATTPPDQLPASPVMPGAPPIPVEGTPGGLAQPPIVPGLPAPYPIPGAEPLTSSTPQGTPLPVPPAPDPLSAFGAVPPDIAAPLAPPVPGNTFSLDATGAVLPPPPGGPLPTLAPQGIPFPVTPVPPQPPVSGILEPAPGVLPLTPPASTPLPPGFAAPAPVQPPPLPGTPAPLPVGGPTPQPVLPPVFTAPGFGAPQHIPGATPPNPLGAPAPAPLPSNPTTFAPPPSSTPVFPTSGALLPSVPSQPPVGAQVPAAFTPSAPLPPAQPTGVPPAQIPQPFSAPTPLVSAPPPTLPDPAPGVPTPVAQSPNVQPFQGVVPLNPTPQVFAPNPVVAPPSTAPVSTAPSPFPPPPISVGGFDSSTPPPPSGTQPPAPQNPPLSPSFGYVPPVPPSTPIAPNPPGLSGFTPAQFGPSVPPAPLSAPPAPVPANFPTPPPPYAPPRLIVESPSGIPQAQLSPPSAPAPSTPPPPIFTPKPLSSNVAPPSPANLAPSPELPAPPFTPPAPSPGQSLGTDSFTAAQPRLGSVAAVSREFRRRVDHHLVVHRDQLGRAQQLQTTIRDVVQQFVSIVSRDEQLRQVFQSADLSDDQRADLKDKTVGLERDLGLTWGAPPDKTPQGEANLTARMLTRGMMI